MNRTNDAELVAAQALTVPGVSGLHGGLFGEVATYLPGRRLLGVRVTETGCDVHVAVAYPHNVVEVAQAVHRVVEPLVTVPVTVTVEDVALAPDDSAAPDPGFSLEGTPR